MENRPGNRDGDLLPEMLDPDTIEGFAQRVRRLFAMTGMSTNQFQRLHNFPDASVSKYQNGTNVPPLRFVLALLDEAKLRGKLRDEAAEQDLRDYGRLLRRLNEDGRGHPKRREFLREYELAMEARRDEQQILEMAEEGQQLAEEEASPSTSAERKALIRAELQQLAVRQQSLIARRDAVLSELAVLRQSYAEAEEPSPGVPVAPQYAPDQYAPHPDQQVGGLGAHAGPRSLPPGGHAHRSSLARFAIGAAVVLVLGVYGINKFAGMSGDGSDAKGTASTAPSQTSSASSAQSSSASPAQTSSGSPTTNASPIAAGWREVYRDRTFTMPMPGGDNCQRDLFDLDADPISLRRQEGDLPPEVDADAFDLEWHTWFCSASPDNRDALDFRVDAVGLSGATVPSPSRCVLDSQTQAITNPIAGGEVGSGTPLHKGASLCVKTDTGNLLYLKVIKEIDNSDGYFAGFTFSATRWSPAS
ncbi:hypothetical protein [Streptomyces sp. NPDC001068]|uniref:hypothetical protein n=1 Tax=Streptomyces sp. NPDC001068 TaxID=3364544 RepID=UPI0036B55163